MATNTHTTEFGKTLSPGTVVSPVKGKQDYYILEHLIGSEYHEAGEKQEIMLNEIILGRDADCRVRFDEGFSTVSRHHASIVRDGDKWKLTQLSKTNTTFLNGKPLQDSWFLQSGDEIQLAVNGPKLIFRKPTDDPGKGLSQRFDSFRDKVIRPYKTAFIAVCCVIALIIAGGVIAGIVIKKQSDNIEEQTKNINEQNEIIKAQKAQIDALYDQLLLTNEQLAETAMRADNAQQDAIKAKREAFRNKAELIKSQENLQEMQNQMQQLNEEINDFYNGIINGEN